MIASIIFGVFSLIFASIFCWFRTEKANVYSLLLKIFSSLCFVLCAVFAIKVSSSNNFNLLILIGLVFGLVGDILLDLKIMYPEDGNKYFVAGTYSFAVGHFFYFISALLYNSAISPKNLLWCVLASVGIAIVLTIAIILISKKLGLDFGKMLYVVISYCFILTFMVAYTIAIAIFNPIYWIFASGMILFLISDMILSMQYFGGKTAKYLIYLNHITYYLAQAMLAISILFII